MALISPGSGGGKRVGAQGRRRTLYGVNVAVAITVALLLLLLVNWFAVWAFARASVAYPGLRSWLRYDLTATRTHTLSPQTQRVLAQRDGPLELVGVYPDGGVEAQAVSDLLEEYRRFDPSVEVRRLDPTRDAAALTALFGQLETEMGGSGDQAESDSIRGTIDTGVSSLDEVVRSFDAVIATFEEATKGLDPADPGDANGRRVLDALAGGLAKWTAEYEQKAALLRQLLGQPLPPLAEVRQNLIDTLRVTRTGRLNGLERELTQAGNDNLLPLAVRDAALRAKRRLEPLRETVARAEAALAGVGVDADYARLRDAVQQSAFVLVRSGDRLRVVSLGDMFVADASAVGAGTDDASAAEALPVRFLGEERLTGAVVSVGMTNPPRLMLVSGDGRPVEGRSGRFNVIAERARASGFKVVPWRVVEEPGSSVLSPPPFGRTGVARTDASGESASPTVWVVLPMNPSASTDTPAKQRIVEALSDGFADGDGVLLMPAMRVDAAFAPADPLLDWAAEQGVRVDPGAVVLRPGSDASAEHTFRHDDWPAHAVTAPLRGRSVWFDLAHPVVKSDSAEDSAAGGEQSSLIPLVTLSAEGMWVERDPLTAGPLEASRPDPGERTEAQVIAAAVETTGNDAGRLAVVADNFWATDTVIINRRAGGNVELFANLAYWLAGLESAIDQSPRTQGLRRIGPISDTGRAAVRWGLLAGVPALTLVSGVCVWLVRRRG